MAMMKQQQSAKRGQMILYLALLAVVVACMVALSLCDHPAEDISARPSGGDTLDIAIEYSLSPTTPMTTHWVDTTMTCCD